MAEPATNNLSLAELARSGRVRIIAALVVTALVGGGLGVIMLRGGQTDMKLLYSGLDLGEAASIGQRLDTAGIRNDIQGGGSAVFVDAGKVEDARMMLSEEGLPSRGSVGWEIFDKSDALGETTFVQNIKKVRALEGELSRTIASLDVVKNARVHLVLPERTVFQREGGDPPKATVVLSLVGTAMTPDKVRAIRNVVATAVPGLTLPNITVVDDQARVWAAGGETEAAGLGGYSTDERRTSMEESLRRKVVELVESIAGVGAAKVQVSADVDFNRVTQVSEEFNPDSRVVRSSETVEETSNNQDTPPGNTTTVAANVPGGAQAPNPSPTSMAADNRSSETINYEINKTNRTEIIEGGNIKRLSVAVVIDDIRVPGAAGAPPTFTPRTPEEIQRIDALVKSAVGFSEARGDKVDVINSSFARPEVPPIDVKPPGPFDFDKFDLVRLLEIAALAITGLALVWFVLRPLVKGLMSRDEDEGAAQATAKGGKKGKRKGKGKGAADDEEDDDDAVAGVGGTRIVSAGGNGRVSIPDGTSTTIAIPMDERLDAGVDVQRISGQVRASSIKKISEVVNQHPDESISIIRSWLAEEGAERA